MTEMIMSSKTAAIHWADIIEYPQTGVKSKILLEDANCRYMLMLVGLGMHIAEHTNPRNATVNVIEGHCKPIAHQDIDITYGSISINWGNQSVV